MKQIVRSLDSVTVEPRRPRLLQAERLHGAAALREAQALRFRIFSTEFSAQLKGAEFGLDMDDYDPL